MTGISHMTAVVLRASITEGELPVHNTVHGLNPIPYCGGHASSIELGLC
jgi:hypothetical protein